MGNSIHISTGVLVATCLLLFSPNLANAQDPAKVSPTTHKVLFENERVRVIDVRAPAGAKVAMHSHPDYIVYALSDYKVKFTSPDGKTAVIEGKAGDTSWRNAETHAPENIGTEELHVLNIEIKTAH